MWREKMCAAVEVYEQETHSPPVLFLDRGPLMKVKQDEP